MTMTERVEFWDAINRYAQACGGDTGQATVGSPRMQAVSDVEGLIKKLEHDRGSLHADSAVASLEAGRAELAERLESLLIATAPGLTTHLDHEKDETRALLSRTKAGCLAQRPGHG